MEEEHQMPTSCSLPLFQDWLWAADAVSVFRAIVEATCFGAKAIVDRFNEQGVPVKGLIGLGGVARKSPFIMQMMADVMNMPIRIHRSEQTCALGAGNVCRHGSRGLRKSRRCNECNGAGL
jgi:ribulose kinase